jgi:hypothetical protein
MSTISTTITHEVTLSATGVYSSPLTVTASGNVSFMGARGGEAIYGPLGGYWTINNQGTVQSTTSGVILETGGTVQNGEPGSNTALISSNYQSIVALTDAGTVLNFGSIISSGEHAIELGQGGIVVNGAGGFIDGATGGVLLGAGGPSPHSGTVQNSGTITSDSNGVELQSGGLVGNLAGGTIGGVAFGVYANVDTTDVTNLGTISARGTGVLLEAGGTVTNGGTIIGDSGTAVAFGGTGNMLVLDPGADFSGIVNGGTGSNTLELAASGSTGTVSGLGTSFVGFTTVAVDPGASWEVSGTASALTNDGTVVVDQGSLIFATITSDVGDSGVILVENGGTAEFSGGVGSSQRVAFADATGTVKLDVTPGAPLTAYSGFSAKISGFQSGDKVDFTKLVATSASYSGGVLTLDDGTTQVAHLSLSTPYANPTFSVEPDGSGGTLLMVAPSSASSGDVFAGTYSNGIALTNPATQNPATITATGNVSNDGYAISGNASQPWTIENLGTVSGQGSAGIGISLAAGGTITNGQNGSTNGYIYGYGGGIAVSAALGSVVNYGSINGGTGPGIYLGAGGTVTNQGIIQANAGYYSIGVDLAGAGTVFNGASNQPGAVIEGYSTGVYLGADGSTLVNAGHIAGGGSAVYLAGSYDTLVVQPGATFHGAVTAAGAYDTLDLAAGTQVGTLTGLGSKFTGFSDLGVDPGATWQVSGPGRDLYVTNDGTITVDGSHLGLGPVASDTGTFGFTDISNSGDLALFGKVSGQERVDFTDHTGTLKLFRPLQFFGRILGFRPGDTIDLAHKAANEVSFANQHLIVSYNGTTVADLAMAGNHTASEFSLSPDGHGGTDIILANASLAVLKALS